jgi:FRG domain-containing protein
MSRTTDIPVIKTPPATGDPIKSLSDFLKVSERWHHDHSRADGGMLSDLWYRGVNRHFDSQAPGVYRHSFTERAKKIEAKDSIEGKRLRLERDTVSQFRSAGAAFLEGFSKAQIYFVAQHFGMPTRLLDWSTNPLAALFFACDGQDDEDGFVYAMDAKHVIPKDAKIQPGKKLYRGVMTMRHAVVEYAIGISLWEQIDRTCTPYVLPVRPDVIPGRIGQQSSVFTLHMHKANLVENSTLVTLMIDKASKPAMREELHRVNVNQFTTYYDLDHLSKEIKRAWGI